MNFPRRPPSDYQYEFLARLIRDPHTGTTMLQLLGDEETVELKEDDQFVTVRTCVDISR